MAGHWTYADFADGDALEQGDILQPTSELVEIFTAIHPHFAVPKYLGFLVLTQTCDLVLRKDSPKANYVSLAPIRPLGDVLPKILSHISEPISPRRVRASAKPAARQLLERLFNQNEQALGLFSIHPDADLGIGEAAVAFLRVTVSLRSDHYDVLVRARTGRLKPQFQAKLGWLVGNLYVRPATPDWHDQPGGKKVLKALVDEQLEDVQWLDDDMLEAAKTAGIDVSSATTEILEQYRPAAKMDRALEQVDLEITKLLPDIGEESRRQLKHRLKQNPKFGRLLR